MATESETWCILPPDLRRILVEVARTGTCSSLHWSRSLKAAGKTMSELGPWDDVSRRLQGEGLGDADPSCHTFSLSDGVFRNDAETRETRQPSPPRRPSYENLSQAMQAAVALVLDFSYSNRGGYTMSPAEHRKAFLDQDRDIAVGISSSNGHKSTRNTPEGTASSNQAKLAFMDRRSRLLRMLNPRKNKNLSTANSNLHKNTAMSHMECANHAVSQRSNTPHIFKEDVNKTSKSQLQMEHSSSDVSLQNIDLDSSKEVESYMQYDDDYDEGAPFTLQRVAEVLAAPERVSFHVNSLLLVYSCRQGTYGYPFAFFHSFMQHMYVFVSRQLILVLSTNAQTLQCTRETTVRDISNYFF